MNDGRSRRPLRTVTAAEAASADHAAIDAGVPARALMQRAGAAAAAEITRRCADRLDAGVAVYAGSGNNGGDGWVVAAALHAAGVRVRVRSTGEPKTDDARAEREHARAAGVVDELTGGERVVVDSLLGTGTSGTPRGPVADMIAEISRYRDAGAIVVALDIPSGVDADSGAAGGAAVADLTLTFGSLKRGLLVARGHAGRIVLLDIGLGAHVVAFDRAPLLLAGPLPADAHAGFAVDAHKGTRKKVAIVGGAAGTAGAVVLAAQGALRTGVGMVRCVVAAESMPVVQTALPAALASPWPADDAALTGTIADWADAVALGPGLGRGTARALVERILEAFDGPVVLDADALNAFAGDLPGLRAVLGGRAALLTPHPLELARLADTTVDEVLARRFDIGAEVAAATGAAVLLKGVPTVVSGGGERIVVAAGTPALATGGSGDVLAGIAATVLAQRDESDAMRRAVTAGAYAALAHGRAAELATARRGSARGTTLADVIDALPSVWRESGEVDRLPYPILAELADVPG